MNSIRTFSSQYFGELEKATRIVDRLALEMVAETMWSAYERGNAFYFVGNGGSASTASHFATDLGKGTLGHRGDLPIKGFRAISLSDNPAMLTAWANDAGYERVFAGQLERLGLPGDVVVAISASGNSPNVLAAVETAKRNGCVTVALTGFGGGKLATQANHSLVIDSYNYGVVEDAHMCLTHIISQYLAGRLLRETGDRFSPVKIGVPAAIMHEPS